MPTLTALTKAVDHQHSRSDVDNLGRKEVAGGAEAWGGPQYAIVLRAGGRGPRVVSIVEGRPPANQVELRHPQMQIREPTRKGHHRKVGAAQRGVDNVYVHARRISELKPRCMLL